MTLLPLLRATALAGMLAITAGAATAQELNLYTTREPGLIKPLLDEFTKTSGITVNAVMIKDGLAERVAAEGAQSPADVLMTVDFGNLIDLVEKGLTQPIDSATLNAAIPANLRGADGSWYALSARARVLYAAKDLEGVDNFTYEDLADPKWKGKVCIRSGQHPYNTALIAAVITKDGAAKAEEWLRGVKANLARKAGGGDRDVAKDIMGGICELGIANSYYVGLMRSGKGGPEQQTWAEAIKVVLPTFADRAGTHVNISGASVAKNAPNKENAVKLLEYLVSDEAQKVYAQSNFEFPVKAGVAVDPIVAAFGEFRIDPTPLTEIAANRAAASELAEKVGFDEMTGARAAVPARLSIRLDPWLLAQAGIALLVVLPVLGLAIEAARGSQGFWGHLAVNVLPGALKETALLLLGVGSIVVLVGAGTAWLVSAYRFPGSGWLDWALLLPLAMPTYVIAYAYLDVLHPIGPVQTALRAILGIDGPRGLRLPDIRSMTGCILILGFVLYPYVYLTTRAMFLMQAASQIEAARLLGRGGIALFATVAVPLARPAIAVGTSLALLEALNDVGAAEFLGVRTLTVSVYTTWVTRSDLPGAAQLSLVMLAVVLLLILLERRGRARQGYAGSSDGGRTLAPKRLAGAKAALALAATLVPITLGFVVPASYLVVEATKRIRFSGLPSAILTETLTTLALSLTATVIAVLLGLVVAYAPRLTGGGLAHGLGRLAAIGYALPGTVLAIGLLMPLGTADRAIDGTAQFLFGVATGLVFLGSSAALIYAYVARFLAISAGGIEAGLGQVSSSLDHAARLLGQDGLGVLRRIHLPLARSAVATAALLVFVDCMKELPATLLLRPLNVETLATHLYGEAARGTYEDGAIAALLIVAVGLLPVIALARVGRPSALR